MATLTTNHSLQKPDVAGDKGAWGAMLNSDLDILDGLLKVATDGSGTFLSADGGVVNTNLVIGATGTSLNSDGDVHIGKNLYMDGSVIRVQNDGDKYVNFQNGAGTTTQAQISYSTSAGRLTMQTIGTGAKAVQMGALADSWISGFYDNGTVVARVETGGTTLPAAQSLVTREKGDNRYLLVADLEDLGGNVATSGGKTALTNNDGAGNSNVTFNHMDGVPTQDGSSYRIACATDSDTANLTLQLANNVTDGVAPGMSTILTLTTTKATISRDLDVVGNIDSTGAVNATTGQFSGNVYLLNTLRFDRTDGSVYFTTEDATNNSNQFVFHDVSATAIASITKNGTSLPASHTIVTREKGDNRYVLESGDTMSGTLTAPILVSTGRIDSYNQLRLTRTNGASYIDVHDNTGGTAPLVFRNISGTTLASIGKAGTTVSNTHTILTREKGDARYANKSGDSFTGTVVVAGGTQLSAGGRVQAGEYLMSKGGRAYFDADGTDRGIYIRNSNFDLAAQAIFEDGSKRFLLRNDHSNKEMIICNIGDSGMAYFYDEGVLVARLDPVATNTGLTLLTRDRGDARYTQISSDISKKEEISDMPPVLEGIVMQLRPRTFFWKDSESDPKPDGMMFGQIAQEVEQILPQAVIGAEGDKGLDALTLIGVLVKAVQELTARVEQLEGA